MDKFIFRCAILIGLTVLICYGAAFASDPFAEMGVVRPDVRMEAPNFVLRDIKGELKGLTDFKGKVILLNFWATWCPGCREEMPSLESLWERFRTKGVVVVAVAVDRGSRDVKSFAERLGLTFPILLDNGGTVRRDYEVSALPMTYIIGKDGKISGRMYGGRDWAAEKAASLIGHLLMQGK